MHVSGTIHKSRIASPDSVLDTQVLFGESRNGCFRGGILAEDSFTMMMMMIMMVIIMNCYHIIEHEDNHYQKTHIESSRYC